MRKDLMMKPRRNSIPITDFIVISIILLFTVLLFFRNRNAVGADVNVIQSPEEVNIQLIKTMKNTPLDASFKITNPIKAIRKGYFNTLNFLSMQIFFNPIIHFINKNQGVVEDCSSCSTATSDGSCGDSSQPVISYPIDLTIKALHSKIGQYPKLMIIDVRDTPAYVLNHISGSVSIPLLELVDQMFTIDRWTEIVVVGDSYLQTKLAGESLLRLNFHRLHRLMLPVNRWDGKMESFS